MVTAKVSVAVLLGLSLGVLLAELKATESVMSVLAFPGNLGSQSLGVSIVMVVSKMVGLYWKEPMKVDDDWGYPYFRKPPFWIQVCICPRNFSAMHFLHSSMRNFQF